MMVVTETEWCEAIAALAQGSVTLLSLWGDIERAHMALLIGPSEIAAIGLDCPGGQYPSVGAVHAPAIRLERAMRDIFGLQPNGLPDTRPWLDHGRWGDETPPAASYPFLPVHGDALHQVPVGPVHAGIIEPGHFRFTAEGETVVRLEERLGYAHKASIFSWPVPKPTKPLASPPARRATARSPMVGDSPERSRMHCG